MFQQITMVGNLGRDPEMRFTPTGQQVCNFSVAVDDSYTDKSGEKHERTIWLRVTTWGKQAEACNAHLAKGSRVLVIGKLTGDENGGPKVYESKSGPRASFEVNAANVRFLSPAPEGKGQPKAEEYAPEDDIPF